MTVRWPEESRAPSCWEGAIAFQLPRPALTGLLIAAVYGGVDELHQGFVAGRTPLVTDVLIDAAGALIGVTVWWYLTRRRSRGDTGSGPTRGGAA